MKQILQNSFEWQVIMQAVCHSSITCQFEAAAVEIWSRQILGLESSKWCDFWQAAATSFVGVVQ
jgi:hypothetical protein